jgi:hypothetical protein
MTGLNPSRSVSDFGTTGDPGNNVFACNSSMTTNASGFDVYVGFDMTNGGTSNGTLNLSGNQWDHAPPSLVMATSAAPNGQDLWENPNITLPTITTDGATVANVTCDPGRVRGP